MPHSAKAILHQAFELPSNDRAALVEGLIASLDMSNPPLDVMWLKKAEDRLAAYRAGELGAIDAERIFADLGGKFEEKTRFPRSAFSLRSWANHNGQACSRSSLRTVASWSATIRSM